MSCPSFSTIPTNLYSDVEKNAISNGDPGPQKKNGVHQKAFFTSLLLEDANLEAHESASDRSL